MLKVLFGFWLVVWSGVILWVGTCIGFESLVMVGLCVFCTVCTVSSEKSDQKLVVNVDIVGLIGGVLGFGKS